jgi:hypothetical protein
MTELARLKASTTFSPSVICNPVQGGNDMSSCSSAVAISLRRSNAGYAFQIETTQHAHLAGARIEEVPFVFSKRIAGASKMTLRISLEGIGVTLVLRRHRRSPRRQGLLQAL